MSRNVNFKDLADTIKCNWTLFFSGKELTNEEYGYIDSISANDTLFGSDTITIRVNDPDMVFLNKDIFIEETPVVFNCYWSDSVGDYLPVYTFSGFVSAIDVVFPENGTPMLTLTCLDYSHLLNREKKKRTWEKVTNADVVRAIALEYGLVADIEEGYPFETEDNIAQSNETDIAFLESLARSEREPFYCKYMRTIENGTVYNKLVYRRKLVSGEPIGTYTYRDNDFGIVSFSPQINKETKHWKVKKDDICTDTKTLDSAEASDKSTVRDIEPEGTPVKTFNTATGKWE